MANVDSKMEVGRDICPSCFSSDKVRSVTECADGWHTRRRIPNARVHYTDDQLLTIALAELASAMGVRLSPREFSKAPDYKIVQHLTEHVRAPKITPLPVLECDCPHATGGEHYNECAIEKGKPWRAASHLRNIPMVSLLHRVRTHSDVTAASDASAAFDEIERRLSDLTLENLRLKRVEETRTAAGRAAAKKACFCPMPAAEHLPGCPRRNG